MASRSSMPYGCVVIQSSIVGEPSRATGASSASGSAGAAMQHLDRPRHFDEMDRVDDPGAPPRRDALDRLRVGQARIHAGCGVDEPGPQVTARVRRVLRSPVIRQAAVERRHHHAQADRARGGASTKLSGIGHRRPAGYTDRRDSSDPATSSRPSEKKSCGPPALRGARVPVIVSGARRRYRSAAATTRARSRSARCSGSGGGATAAGPLGRGKPAPHRIATTAAATFTAPLRRLAHREPRRDDDALRRIGS